MEKYGDALTLYICGYLNDPHEAEDLMIEAFSRLFAKERPIRGAGSFQAYLYKTARNLALRHRQGRWHTLLRLDELSFEPQSDVLADTALLRSGRAGYGRDKACVCIDNCLRFDYNGRCIMQNV